MLDVGGSEVAGSAGNLPASSASQDAVKKISFKNQRFIDEKLAVALTGHSERGTLQSLMAGLGVPKEERQFLGRWSASGSDEYVRTYRLMVKRMLGKLGEVIDNKNIFEVVDEAEAFEALKEKSEKKLGGTAGLEEALAHSLSRAKETLINICGNLHATLPYYLLETAKGEDQKGSVGNTQRAPAVPAPAGDLPANEESNSDLDAERAMAKYVVADCKVRTGGRVSRLHLRKGCHLGRSLAFSSYELIYEDPPPARSYTDFCRRCWPKGRPKANLAELTSDSDGETTSSDEGAGIMTESLRELDNQ